MALIDGLVSYWKLDEAAGNADDAHDANDGAVDGCTYSVAGKINTAYSFDGNDFVEITDSANLNFGTGSFSCAGWIKTSDSAHYQRLMSKGDMGVGNGWGIVSCRQATQKAWFLRQDSGSELYVIGTTNMADGAWHYLVGTYDSVTKTITLYVDGASEGTPQVCTGTTTDIAKSLFIGCGSNPDTDVKGEFHYGSIDEVAVWGRCLSAAEVAQLWNDGAGLAYPFVPVGTNMKLNISDVFKDVDSIKINVGDDWKDVESAQINIGDDWKNVF